MSEEVNVRLGPGVYKVSTVQDPLADSAYKIYTQKKETDALYYLTFVDSNNNNPQTEYLYTNAGIGFNPVVGNLSIGSSVQIGQNSFTYGTPSLYIGNGSVSGITSFGGKVRVGGNEIQSSSGQAVVSLGNSDAIFENSILVKKDLVVQQNFVVNTPVLTLESRTFDIGLLGGGVGIATNTTWDLGLIFHHTRNDTRQRSALIWEDSTSSFQFANGFTETFPPSIYDSPQIGVTSFAPVVMKSLMINSVCSSGTTVVIGCNNNELQLQNIVIDEGEYQ